MARTSDKQEKIYNYIVEFIAENHFGPTIREISQAVGLSSSSAVYNQLKNLESQGRISTGSGKKRAISVTGGVAAPGIPLLGTVRAGAPILAYEDVVAHIPFTPKSGKKDDYFGLLVKGDSMKDAGILEGDAIVVHRQPKAENGEIVVALLEDEATVKRLKLVDGHVWLMPENAAYSPIPGDEAAILGKVVALVRDY